MNMLSLLQISLSVVNFIAILIVIITLYEEGFNFKVVLGVCVAIISTAISIMI